VEADPYSKSTALAFLGRNRGKERWRRKDDITVLCAIRASLLECREVCAQAQRAVLSLLDQLAPHSRCDLIQWQSLPAQ
jgi:hypothetical protein